MRSNPLRAKTIKRDLDARIANLFGMKRKDVGAITSQFLHELRRELICVGPVWLPHIGLVTCYPAQERPTITVKPSPGFRERIMMEKYGVRTPQPTEKPPTKCPNCGGDVELHGKVSICVNCGSAPFESKK